MQKKIQALELLLGYRERCAKRVRRPIPVISKKEQEVAKDAFAAIWDKYGFEMSCGKLLRDASMLIEYYDSLLVSIELSQEIEGDDLIKWQ